MPRRARPRPAPRPPRRWAACGEVWEHRSLWGGGGRGRDLAAGLAGGWCRPRRGRAPGRGGRSRAGGGRAGRGSTPGPPFPGCVWGSLRGHRGLACAAPRPGPHLFVAARFFSARLIDRRSSRANFEGLCFGPGRAVRAGRGSGRDASVFSAAWVASCGSRAGRKAPAAAVCPVIVPRRPGSLRLLRCFHFFFPVRFCSVDRDRWSSEGGGKWLGPGLHQRLAPWPLQKIGVVVTCPKKTSGL